MSENSLLFEISRKQKFIFLTNYGVRFPQQSLVWGFHFEHLFLIEKFFIKHYHRKTAFRKNREVDILMIRFDRKTLVFN